MASRLASRVACGVGRPALARKRALASALSVIALCGCAHAPVGPILRDGRGGAPTDPPGVEQRVARFESAPGNSTANLDGSWLAARMQETHTPSVSIAVISGGAIEWAHGYGVVAQGETVTTPDTLFQAASLSKPVSAFAAMRLVDQGSLSLVEDVSAKLHDWKIPGAGQRQERPVTLRSILTHSSGLNVEGFNGYEPGGAVPNLRQVLDGAPPANSAPIQLVFTPGSRQRYSGGGFVVLQQLLADTEGAPFAQIMSKLVFDPLQMNHSLFAAELPPALARNAARAHAANGEMLPGRWHVYPELAAAGLWTTPSDLARFALELARARLGQSSVLSQGSAELMSTPQFGRYAFGFSIRGEGPKRAFGHAGANAGFRCAMLLFPERGQGAVVMTNGDGGGVLVREVLRAIGEQYGWPHLAPEAGPHGSPG